MPVLSDKKLEMADIGDVHALMLSQQVTSQQRTHIIRQKTVQNPTRHIRGHADCCILAFGYSGRGMNDSGLSLCYPGSKFMQLSKLLRLSKIRIIGLFFPFLEKKSDFCPCSCTGHKSPAIFVTHQSTSGFGMFLY